MNFWLWLIALLLAVFLKPSAIIVVILGGLLYFSIWLLFGGPTELEINEGCWVKEVKTTNGITQITITDGSKDILQQYNSSKVNIIGNKIYVY